MRTILRYALTILIGLALGIGWAIHTVRAGTFASDVTIGPWRTGRDFGTADASARTRAVVALSGLLALPAKEARYYTASTDDAGRPLDGRCTYRVSFSSKLPAQWWSLTLYDKDGYLAGPGSYSIESRSVEDWQAARFIDDEKAIARFFILVAPQPHSLFNLPTAGLPQFQLTLRLYLPDDGGRGDPPRAVLPSIVKEAC